MSLFQSHRQGRSSVRILLGQSEPRKDVCARGWARTVRRGKDITFIALNDGSCLDSLQVVAESTLKNYDVVARLGTGACLAVQGQPVDQLSYIAEGRADVRVGGARVSNCGAGDFVGEMTALTGLPATATVIATRPLTVWQIDAARLREATRRRDEVSRELEAAFARNYRDKIVEMNRLVSVGEIPDRLPA